MKTLRRGIDELGYEISQKSTYPSRLFMDLRDCIRISITLDDFLFLEK
jgi:hypothetical protein